MAQLTISQLIKMLLFGFVIVLVIYGVSLGFNSYVIPYFKDIGPSTEDPRNLNTQFYETLVAPENVVATLDAKKFFIVDGNKINYFIEDSGIYFKVDFWWDTKAGELIDYKINMDGDYLKKINVGDRVVEYKALVKINGGEVVGSEVYKVTGA